MTKTYVGFSRDHSGSMARITRAAARDYNANIATVRASAEALNQDVIVSVVKCGHGSSGIVHREITNAPVTALQPMGEWSYEAKAGSTPLLDSVGELIEMFESVPDYNDPDVSFMLMITTDGEENSSRKWYGQRLADKIEQLIATDRWTFVFRVPDQRGVSYLRKFGIHPGNILIWDAKSEAGMAKAQEANTQAFTEFFKGRAAGQRSTTKFYANLQDVSITDVKKELVDISSQIRFLPVSSRDAGTLIRPFVEAQLGKAMVRGGAFYQLVKTEPKVQANKRIVIVDKTSGAAYSGDAARQMLALPTYGTVRLAPDELGNFEVFIQSTSVNRKLDANTRLLYWEGVGKAFQEGPSAR